MTEKNNLQGPMFNRDRMALAVSAISILGILVLSTALLWRFTGKDDADKMMTVFTSVLALAGSWVGTILAFYFSKENFESATRHVTALVEQVTPHEKLKSIPVKDKMIRLNQMFHVRFPAAQVNLAKTLDELENSKLGNRIPVLRENAFPAHVIHRSLVTQYFYDRQRESPSPNLLNLSLQDLLDYDSMKSVLANSFAVVGEDATLADAKAAMDAKPNCQDVFVTRGGAQNEPVVGWITNITISDNALV